MREHHGGCINLAQLQHGPEAKLVDSSSTGQCDIPDECRTQTVHRKGFGIDCPAEDGALPRPVQNAIFNVPQPRDVVNACALFLQAPHWDVRQLEKVLLHPACKPNPSSY